MSEELVVEIPEDLNEELKAPEKELEGEPAKVKATDESPLAAQVAAMKKQKSDADAARVAAEGRARDEAARAQRMEAENHRLSQEAAASSTASITNAIAAKASEVTQAETDYRLALESGNYGEAAKVQTRLSKAAAYLAGLEREKEISDARRPVADTGAVRPQPTQDYGDPIDRHIDSMQTGDRAKAWLRAHKECLTDTRKYNLMVGAHQEAVDRGLIEGGDDYFTHLETKLGYRDAGEDEGSVEVEVTPAPKPAKRVLAAAPVSRESTSISGSRNSSTTKVTLDAREKEAAEISGITYAEYARQKLIAIKNGDFERTN